MLTTLKNAFKIKEIRQKILFTLGMLVVIRIGSQLPVPGVDTKFFSQWFAQQTGGAFSFFDAITGGSFLNMSILALNINPYITSSIIMQLLTIAIPKLEEMQRDGEDGRKKMVAITRYVTIALALIQSTAMAIGFGRQGYLIEFNALNVITAITALTAGSAFLMWVGERITEKGIGNGISIVLVINIISRLPQDLSNLFEQFVFGKAPATAILAVVIIFAIIIAMVVLVIILNDGVRKIPVQYAKKMQGRKMVGGQTSNIPLKVNTSGVIPIIFAQSIMQFLIIICSFIGKMTTLINTIPGPVIGGISFLLYGMIGTSGIRILVESQVDYGKSRNMAMTSVIFVVGLSGITVQFGSIQLSGMVLACVIGMLMGLMFYVLDKLKLTNDRESE